MLGTPGIRHVKNCHLGGRQDISVLVSGDHRRFSGNRPCPAGRRFCKQAWCPPSLAGVSAGQRGAHATCAVCPHAPHWLRAASYVRSGYCLRVSTCWVCPCARCSCAVVTLTRLGVTIFVSWLGVRCRAVTRPGLARHFLHHPAAPLPLQSRWFIRACCSSGDSLQHAQVQGVSLLCSDAHLAWCDDFRRLAGVRCRVVTRLDLARHFLHGPAQPSLLRPKWVIRTYPSAESSSQWPSTALMRGHAHTGGSPTVSKHSDAPRACPRAGKGRSRRSICPNVVASMPCAGKGPQALREYWSEGIGSLGSAPRADDSPNALRSPQRSSTGGESRGHQRRPGRLVQQRTVPPSRPLKRCTDVLCQFLSGGQGARARSDAWVLDSVFFVTASTVVG